MPQEVHSGLEEMRVKSELEGTDSEIFTVIWRSFFRSVEIFRVI